MSVFRGIVQNKFFSGCFLFISESADISLNGERLRIGKTLYADCAALGNDNEFGVRIRAVLERIASGAYSLRSQFYNVLIIDGEFL